MSNEAIVVNQQLDKNPIKSFFDGEKVKAKFTEILGKKAQGFVTSVLQIAASNDNLKMADPMSIFNAACVAATLDLPLNNNLGFAYIVPYNQSYQDDQGKWQKRQVAQFQLGYKGFIQLAQRSGQFKTISATQIYEGQLVESNPLTGYRFDFTKKTSDKIIGFAGYFSLINGFEKTLYMSMEEMLGHGAKFSKTFKSGLWQTDQIGMGNKTVIKLLLSKFAPLSIEMQKGVVVDQALINNDDGTDLTYIDNEPTKQIDIDKERERLELMISDETTLDGLMKLRKQISEEDYPELIISIDDKMAPLIEASK